MWTYRFVPAPVAQSSMKRILVFGHHRQRILRRVKAPHRFVLTAIFQTVVAICRSANKNPAEAGFAQDT
jgi:hypothetical protein